MQPYSGVCEKHDRDDDMWLILLLSVRDSKGTFGVCLLGGESENNFI